MQIRFRAQGHGGKGVLGRTDCRQALSSVLSLGARMCTYCVDSDPVEPTWQTCESTHQSNRRSSFLQGEQLSVAQHL